MKAGGAGRTRGGPASRVQNQRYRAIVDQGHLHVRAEHTRLHASAECAQRRHERADERPATGPGAAPSQVGRRPFLVSA